MKEKIVYVAYTNSDLTEGRGADVPKYICELASTARRLSRGIYVQGTDGPVRPIKLVEIDDKFYGPMYQVFLTTSPSKQDIEEEEKFNKRKTLVARIKASGVSSEDLELLGIDTTLLS